MEELFIGNSIIILFWVYISFIIEVEEKSKKVMLMYLITYITNILNIVPTIQSYGILLLALFLEMEFWEDKFKKQIINSVFEKILDFGYIMIAQYALISFTTSLVVGSNYVLSQCPNQYKILIKIVSCILFYISCKNASSEKYKISSFEKIKNSIDSIEKYRKFITNEEFIWNEYCVLSIEDSSFYLRENRYTFLNTYYLRKAYLEKVKKMMSIFWRSKSKKSSLKKFLRGYSTIEMQLLRTLAVEEGYECIIRRKVFEILYARLFWKNLRKYYEKCNCEVGAFKDYILYMYLRLAPCLNKGQEQRIEEVIGNRENIRMYSSEELFILTLCFSGKIKRYDVLEIYEELIQDLRLDTERLWELVEQLNR